MRLPRLLAIAALLTLPSAAAAQGILIPERCRPGCPHPLPRALAVESVNLDTRIQGQVATTRVTQVFRNETGMVMEGTFFFPIPGDASITEFAIWDGDRRLAGEVRPREEARRIYDGIVRRQRDPGLLEYAGENLFQASIFPIPARGTKRLELVYTQVLRAEGSSVGYRYPLGVGRNAAPIERLSGRVTIQVNESLRNVYSPSHRVEVGRDRGATTVTFETNRAAERRDFQLFYSPSRDEVGLSLFTYREPGKDGYFLLLLSPSDSVHDYAAKDVVYVLDTSGSMQDDDKISQARRALMHGIRGLGPEDRYNVVSFAGETRRFEQGLVPASREGRERGVRWVEGLRAVGGTNINDALVEALDQFRGAQGGRARLIVFLTDGLPTVGETDAEQILRNVARARSAGVRIFSFGVGYDVNTRLLDRVAADNGGTADYVEPREDIEVRVGAFFDKVNHPVLTNLRLDLGAVETDRVYPRDLPDLFKGTQLALVGRYSNDRELRNITARLTGNASPSRTYSYPGLRFPMRDERHDFLPRLWATRRVGWLLEQIRSHGENRELRDEVVELGTRYGIVTPYTSFLALEPGARERAEAGGVAQDATSRPRPSRPTLGRAGGNQPPPPPPPPPPPHMHPAPATVSGQGAVQQSREARRMQDAVSVEEAVVTGYGDSAAATTIRRVDSKTFHLREGVWTDADYRAESGLPVTTVRFGSDEYFALVQRTPALARYLALGERVVVVLDGRVYRTTSQ